MDYIRFWRWLNTYQFHGVQYGSLSSVITIQRFWAAWIVAVIVSGLAFFRAKSTLSLTKSQVYGISQKAIPTALASRQGIYYFQWQSLGPNSNTIEFKSTHNHLDTLKADETSNKTTTFKTVAIASRICIALSLACMSILAIDSQRSIHSWLQSQLHLIVVLMIATALFWLCISQLLWLRRYSDHQVAPEHHYRQTVTTVVMIKNQGE